MDSAICIEAKCQLPLTEYTQAGTVEHIHRFPSLDDKRFLINSLNVQSCLSCKSTYSEPHWIFCLAGAYQRARRRAAGEQANAWQMEWGCSIGSKRRQQLSGSPVSTCNHCPSASPVLTAAGTGESTAFCGSTSTGWHLPLGKTDELGWNISWARLTLLAANCTVSLHLPLPVPQQFHFQCPLSSLTLFFVVLFPSQPTTSQYTCYVPWHCCSQLLIQHPPLPELLLPFVLLLLLQSPSWDLFHNAKTGYT